MSPLPPLFITGTDTGVGKTVLTALLLLHLRRHGRSVLAMKPFATGAPTDALLLDQLQPGALSPRQLCPFHFRLPAAPLVAARRERRVVSLTEAVAVIRDRIPSAGTLLLEGCGGLLTPLGPGYSARELIAALRARPVVVAPNRLGVLNQARLVLEVLHAASTPAAAVVLMGCPQPDPSTRQNAPTLRELAAPIPVLELPWLGPNLEAPEACQTAAGRHRVRLDQICHALNA